MSDDLQGIGWWLASDGKWYPPDLRPATRPAIPGEKARIAALLDAAIGVARVRDNVFAQVHGEGRSGTFSSSDRGSTHSGAQNGSVDDRTSGHGTGVRRGADPLPRFRGPDRPSWPFEARSHSEPVTSRSETRWGRDVRQRPDTRRPPSRSLAGPDHPPPAPPGLALPTRAPAAPAPQVPRWKPEKTTAPDRPADRGATFAPGPAEPEATPPQPASTAPQTAPTAPEPAPTAPPPTAVLERSGLPPSARRRPSTVRPPSDLRQAVAGAVARAAAQGPLMPRGPEESDDVTLQTSEPSAMWPDYSPTTPPLGARPSALVAPIEPATETQPAIATEIPTDAGQRAPDPYEEFARLAGEHALAATAPRRRSNRPSTASATGSPPSAVEAPEPRSTQIGRAHV